ncbi:MAG: hypothetical protein HN580_15020 [Deltaproteobacteria bacterium]|jgi:curved DNA-binding protein CbpA|nr:hypothetical protein [Deltaproteobacteria bacterium]MBT4268484.1 hypothetical protein [Deltaproteobacteria bacterium]MBT4644006.1 hypothetical protein [Deltaproteobacteria bacterium]MBT6500785.1 hypothetical protein [Deltaproteobacteria bacterium]MBT6614608.1 hypothetical protein [Deltaproteobacteria bacterium]
MIAYRVLGTDFCDDDAEIRAAYLRSIKTYSPEKSPEEYKTIRKAYELIETGQKRIEYFLFGNDLEFELEEYERLFIKTDKQITREKWDRLCQIYQENK